MASTSRESSTMASTSPPSRARRDVRRHEKYYWEDGNVVFQVEDTLFRVHRYLFEQSAVFGAMFSLPPPTGLPVEGSSDSNPVHLKSVSATSFEHLLWYMYPGFHDDRCAIPADGWVQVLDMATMFDFERIRASAISVLSRCADPMFRLKLANRFHIDEWFIDCYADLCMRPAYFTQDELEQLGYDTALRLMHARELVRSHLFRRAHGQGALWPCPNGRGSKKTSCAERVATATCEVLLKGTDSTTLLAPTLHAALEPKKDRTLRENGVCGYCALQWDKLIKEWLAVEEVRKILKGIFRPGTDGSRESSPARGLSVSTSPRELEGHMSTSA